MIVGHAMSFWSSATSPCVLLYVPFSCLYTFLFLSPQRPEQDWRRVPWTRNVGTSGSPDGGIWKGSKIVFQISKPPLGIIASMTVCLYVYLYVCPSVYLSVCLSVCVTVCMFVFMYACCLSIHLYICLDVRLYVCLSVRMSLWLSERLSTLEHWKKNFNKLLPD